MAKIETGRVARLLAAPGSYRAVLFYGADAGLARERAETLVRAVLDGASDDMFRLTEMSRDEAARPGALAAEMSALAMTGGRRVVRLREAGDALTAALEDALAGSGEALLVLEGGDLPFKSRLRTAAEASADIAVVACSHENPAQMAGTITQMLQAMDVRVEASVAAWLAERIGEDRMLLRRAIEILGLHAGAGGVVDEASALVLIADGPSADLDLALMAATLGDAAVADRALDATFNGGGNPVMVVRATLRHVQRLHEAAVAGGNSGILRPPVFGRGKAAFDRALRLWPIAALESQLASLVDVERRTKTTAYRAVDEAIARAAIGALSRQAASFARG